MSTPNLLEDNRIFPGAEIFKKHNSKVKLEPIFSMPKARRKSPFEQKNNEHGRNIGPGSYEMKKMTSGSYTIISTPTDKGL